MNAEYEPQEIAQQAANISQWARQQNLQYSFEEVANFLEKQAKLIHDRRTERRTKLLAPREGTPVSPAAPAKGQSTGNGHRAQARPEPRTAPTVANGVQSRRGAREQRELEEAEDLAALKLAMAKDRALTNGKAS